MDVDPELNKDVDFEIDEDADDVDVDVDVDRDPNADGDEDEGEGGDGIEKLNYLTLLYIVGLAFDEKFVRVNRLLLMLILI